MLSMANTLKEIGVDRENIMYFAKDGRNIKNYVQHNIKQKSRI